tara:strand:+ start:758 stop:1108 length:351 start_codon:yes stop_codon:yes gene_type:complete
MSVKIVRLASGEELICSFEGLEEKVRLSKVAVLIPTGAGKIALAPWVPYAVEKAVFEISNRHIVFTIDPHNELLNEYNSVFGSGLFVPPSAASAPLVTPSGAPADGPAGASLKLTD